MMLCAWSAVVFLIFAALSPCSLAAPTSTPHAHHNVDLSRLKVTYESCKASLERLPPAVRVKNLSSVRWVHIPKAGTSFAAALYAYVCTHNKPVNNETTAAENATRECEACGEEGMRSWPPLLREKMPYEDLSVCDSSVTLAVRARSHRSYKRWSEGHVGLFREPRARLVSAYNYNKHSFGIRTREEFVKNVKNLDDYINTAAILGCATKMLVGSMCATPMNLTTEDLNEALTNLRSFSFVGLTEAYNASICLFHHQHGGDVFPFEFAYVREAPPVVEGESFRLPGGSKRVDPTIWRSLPKSTDPLDEIIYAEAKRIFVSNLIKYGLLSP